MVAPRRLGHLVLRVKDLTRSERFYTEVVGLRVTAREMGMVFLRAGNSSSHELALAPARELNGSVNRAIGLSHFAWEMNSFAELQEIYLRIKESGIPIAGIGDHGISIGVYLSDPDGNHVELFYELPTSEWPEGNIFAGTFPMKLTG
jgi:catechol 2,3-dioxygenase